MLVWPWNRSLSILIGYNKSDWSAGWEATLEGLVLYYSHKSEDILVRFIHILLIWLIHLSHPVYNLDEHIDSDPKQSLLLVGNLTPVVSLQQRRFLFQGLPFTHCHNIYNVSSKLKILNLLKYYFRQHIISTTKTDILRRPVQWMD